MKTQIMKVLLTLSIAMTAVGCGVIPSEYRGTFRDSASGTTLVLKAKGGVFTDAQGKSTKAKAQDLKFENLAKGQAGIYVSANSSDKNALEVFWIAPNMETRQEAVGVVWFQSEVIYSLLNMEQKGKASAIDIMRCEKGTVMLDMPNRRFEIGCGANPESFRLSRVKK